MNNSIQVLEAFIFFEKALPGIVLFLFAALALAPAVRICRNMKEW